MYANGKKKYKEKRTNNVINDIIRIKKEIEKKKKKKIALVQVILYCQYP